MKGMMNNYDQLAPHEALTMLDRLVHTRGISENDQNALVSMEKTGKIRNKSKETSKHSRLFCNVFLVYVKAGLLFINAFLFTRILL